MSEAKDGGPAFPRIASSNGIHPAQAGMSLRDWFAGQALTQLAHPKNENVNPAEFARDVYHMADAMLAERAKARGEQQP